MFRSWFLSEPTNPKTQELRRLGRSKKALEAVLAQTHEAKRRTNPLAQSANGSAGNDR